MSRWSQLSGTVIIHKSKHCSIKKLANLIFDDFAYGDDVSYDGDCYVCEVNIHIREEGERCWNQVQKFVDELTNTYKANCNLELRIKV